MFKYMGERYIYFVSAIAPCFFAIHIISLPLVKSKAVFETVKYTFASYYAFYANSRYRGDKGVGSYRLPA